MKGGNVSFHKDNTYL